MKKFLIFVLCLLGIELNFLNVSSAELILYDTNNNGYKTYFDSESLTGSEEGGHKVISARIVGYTPQNEKLIDIVEKFTVIDNELYFSVFERDWEKGGDDTLKAWSAILNYVDKRASQKNSTSTNPPGDVWIQSDASGDWYVQTHKISEDSDKKEFTVPLKLVVNGKLGNNRPQLFKYSGGSWYAKYRDSSMDFELVNSNELYRKMFDACKPSCRLAQSYPR